MREIWVHNTVARMLDNDENNLVSGRYLTVANMQEVAYSLLPTDTASGSVASFPDGSAGAPIKSLTVNIEPRQEGSGEPSPDNVRPISGWTAAGVTVNGETITHEFRDAQGNTLTVYGGEDELAGGKLRVTAQLVTYDGSEQWKDNGSSGVATATSGTGFSEAVMSNTYVCLTHGAGSRLNNGQLCLNTGRTNLLVRNDAALTVEEFVSLLQETPLQVVYELTTPIEYDLTAEHIRTLYGDNTIFADCGNVEVTYKADIGLYIDKKLASQNAALTNNMNNITVLDTVKATLSKRRAK